MNCTNAAPLGLSSRAAARLEQLFGSPAEVFYSSVSTLDVGWRKASDPARLAARDVPGITNSWSIEVDGGRAHLADGLWLDLDQKKDIMQAHLDALTTVEKLQAVGVDPACCSYFASGGKGFHVFVPLDSLVPGGVDGVGRLTCEDWAQTCREFVFVNLCTDSTDNIYSAGRGRMFRQPNVQRPDGRYKVQISLDELKGMDLDGYREVTSHPRQLFTVPALAPITEVNPAWMKAFRGATQYRKRGSSRTQQAPRQVKAPEAVRRDVLALLKQIGECGYADWLRVGSALKSSIPGEDGLQVWDAWSRQFGSYRKGECASRWGGLDDGRVSTGTLVYLARMSSGGGK